MTLDGEISITRRIAPERARPPDDLPEYRIPIIQSDREGLRAAEGNAHSTSLHAPASHAWRGGPASIPHTCYNRRGA